MERLASAREVYGCTCTRSMLGEADSSGERAYPGTCRGKPRDRDVPASLRACIEPGAVLVEDLLVGPIAQEADAQGDVVIRDIRGQWTYQFCVVVDDLRHGVNLIIRGEDLQISTARQAALGAMLGRTDTFVTVHHPLIMAPDGRKLSIPIRNEENGTIENVAKFGVSVPEPAFEAVAQDKRDDGIVENNRFGVKRRGKLTADYQMPFEGGFITKW